MIPNIYNDSGCAFEFYRSFIEWCAKQTRPGLYVEIGTHSGGLVARIAPHCELAIGVDIVSHPDWPIHRQNNTNLILTQASSDTFFNAHRVQRIDVCFIDGDHSARQVYTDTINAMQHMSTNGMIILHDTNPPDLEHTRPELCGTAYKALAELQGDYETWQFYTFPVRYGLTLLSRKGLVPQW